MLLLLWGLPTGAAAQLHCAALICVALAMCFSGWLRALGVVVGAFCFAYGFAVTGHVARTGSVLLQLGVCVHVLIAAYWIGILWPLHRLIRNRADKAVDVARGFGRLARFAVPLLALLGGWMALSLVEDARALYETAYGRALSVKVVGVAVMLGLGAFNTLRHVPALARGVHGADTVLLRVLRVDMAFAVGVVALTAALTTLAAPT